MTKLRFHMIGFVSLAISLTCTVFWVSLIHGRHPGIIFELWGPSEIHYDTEVNLMVRIANESDKSFFRKLPDGCDTPVITINDNEISPYIFKDCDNENTKTIELEPESDHEYHLSIDSDLFDPGENILTAQWTDLSSNRIAIRMR